MLICDTAAFWQAYMDQGHALSFYFGPRASEVEIHDREVPNKRGVNSYVLVV